MDDHFQKREKQDSPEEIRFYYINLMISACRTDEKAHKKIIHTNVKPVNQD